MSHNVYTHNESGLILECRYDYEPALPGDEIDPPWEAQATIYEILINGVECYNAINPALIQEIEALIVECFV